MNPSEPSKERRVRFSPEAETMLKGTILTNPRVAIGVREYARINHITCVNPFTGQTVPVDYQNETNPDRILNLFYGNLEHALKADWKATKGLENDPELADIDMDEVDLNVVSRKAMGTLDEPAVQIDRVLENADPELRKKIEKLANKKQLMKIQEDLEKNKKALLKSQEEAKEKDAALEETKRKHEKEEKDRNQHEAMRNKAGPGFSQVLKEAARFNLEIASMVAIMDIIALVPFTLVFISKNIRDVQPETPEEWLQVFMKTGGDCLKYVEENLGVGVAAYNPDENNDKNVQFAAQQAAQAAAAARRPAS